MTASLAERLIAGVTVNDAGCWVPRLRPSGGGYVLIGTHPQRAHRVVYEYLVGPIPEGWDLDHMCHDPAICTDHKSCPHRVCCNPNHLAPKPHAENVSRNTWKAKAHCPKGHPYDEANTYVRPGYGWRLCRTCNRERSRANYQKRRAAS